MSSVLRQWSRLPRAWQVPCAAPAILAGDRRSQDWRPTGHAERLRLCRVVTRLQLFAFLAHFLAPAPFWCQRLALGQYGESRAPDGFNEMDPPRDGSAVRSHKG